MGKFASASLESALHLTLRRNKTIQAVPLKFDGENLSLEEYQRLSLKERSTLQRRLQERNHLWLQEKFSALRAAWLVVVDGEIIDSGKSLENEPMAPQLLKICQQTGKFPFVFINDDYMAIEESASRDVRRELPTEG